MCLVSLSSREHRIVEVSILKKKEKEEGTEDGGKEMEHEEQHGD
jgi:hypothetical protein